MKKNLSTHGRTPSRLFVFLGVGSLNDLSAQINGDFFTIETKKKQKNQKKNSQQNKISISRMFGISTKGEGIKRRVAINTRDKIL